MFHSIKPLFANKPTLLVINKIDITRPSDLSPSNAALLAEITGADDVTVVQTSCYTEEGIMDVRNAACDALHAHRVETKLKGSKINTVANRIHVAMPKPRDDIVREPFIPDAIKTRRTYDKNDPDRPKLERDIELEEGGPGVYNINMKSEFLPLNVTDNLPCTAENYLLANPEWKMDIMPEIMDGKNVADFIDPDIAEKLEALEREEEKLEAEGFYDEEEEIVRQHFLSPKLGLTQGNSSTLMTNAKRLRLSLFLSTKPYHSIRIG